MTLNMMRETVARRLQDLRKMAGLSQAALAERMGTVTKSAIEKFEKAEMVPAPQTLSRMAEVFDVMEDDLVRPYAVSVDYDRMRYRKRGKMPKREVERLQRTYGTKLERYVEVERLLGVEVPFALSYGDMPVRGHEDARRVALRFRQDMGWGMSPVISPIRQLEARGLKVFVLSERESANRDFDGMCYRDGGMAVVILKKCESTEHDRFTLFHEMGHLLMATGDLDGRELESLCNAFASEVLLPREVFLRHFYKGRGISPSNLKMLQREWGISCEAQMYKARDLGVITQNRYVGYCVRRNRNPELKAWLDGSAFPAEGTSRFEGLVRRAQDEFKITAAKAASLLGNPAEGQGRFNA